MRTVLLAIALGAALAAQKLEVRVLSGRADMVTGGSALVEIRGDALDKVSVRLNGRDIAMAFRPARAAGTLVGKVEGLKLQKNALAVKAGGHTVKLELINYAVTGPVFSGPHQSPFVCQTEEAGLGAPLDADCSAKSQVRYYYKSAEPAAQKAVAPGIPRGFKVFDPSAPRPTDLAHTTTTQGKKVDYVVRVESGTINRAVYQISYLHEPGKPLPDPWTNPSAWNGRLVYTFGGGCKPGYRQGLLTGGMSDAVVSKGYAEAASSLNVFGNNCDDVISAETLMMVKEHFVKEFGVPVHTIGNGGSGGSMQQYLIAQNYPGLLDGITPGASFPDITSMIAPVVDCSLLAQVFDTSSLAWTDDQKTAVSGFATWKVCASWSTAKYAPDWVRPDGCGRPFPKALIYDPAANPKGARCDLQDNEVNVYGRDPKTGFARRALDNVGVQYGLAAFKAGKISAEQFLELNERIGGYDADGNIVAGRSVGDPVALRAAYETGRVNSGKGLAATPIIDYKPNYLDQEGNLHDHVRAFSVRARLIRANGNADNQVMFTAVGRYAEPVRLMDHWLDNIAKDVSSEGAAIKVVRNKPADLVDACWTADGQKVDEPASYRGPGRCNELYPAFGDPRIGAGGPLTDDVLKCALKPVDAKDYAPALNEGQVARLRGIFPQGVCDYGRSGVGQEFTARAWARW